MSTQRIDLDEASDEDIARHFGCDYDPDDDDTRCVHGTPGCPVAH